MADPAERYTCEIDVSLFVGYEGEPVIVADQVAVVVPGFIPPAGPRPAPAPPGLQGPVPPDIRSPVPGEWENRDMVQHTVTAGTRANPTGQFDSRLIQGGRTFQYTFHWSGTYEYFCRIHPDMAGTVVVQPQQ